MSAQMPNKIIKLAQMPTKSILLDPIKLNKGPANLIFSFLNAKELGRLSVTSPSAQELSSKVFANKKAEILLHLVLNPSAENVNKLRAMIQAYELNINSNNPKLASFKNKVQNIEIEECPALIKTKGHEEYEVNDYTDIKKNQELRKIKKCKRQWSKISPLEAAAWSGDNFLVREILKFVPKKLYKQAVEQLQGVLNRQESQENGCYLAPLKPLIKAYNAFLAQYKIFENDINAETLTEENWKILDNLWMAIGICQKFLSTYFLQEFCDIRPHDPMPSFDKEPLRRCFSNVGGPINLDSVGTLYSLHKGRWRELLCVSVGEGRVRAGFLVVANGEKITLDLAAFNHLCELRTNELGNIIKELLQVAAENSENASNSAQTRRVLP